MTSTQVTKERAKHPDGYLSFWRCELCGATRVVVKRKPPGILSWVEYVDCMKSQGFDQWADCEGCGAYTRHTLLGMVKGGEE